MKKFESWGRYPKANHKVREVAWTSEELSIDSDLKMLPYGKGRSYGDSCLNDNGMLLSTSKLNRFISFDERTGLLRCESGVTLEDILYIAIPKKWFLPVAPGTKFVTVGGAIANDVHGKNHHSSGTFGHHVTQFELLRSDGERLICSPENNSELFYATIAGLGLTGLILWAEIKLKKINNPFIEMDSIKVRNLDEFFHISKESEGYEYTVSWLDSLAKGSSLGRGIFMRGNSSEKSDNELPKEPKTEIWNLPFEMPGFFLNKWSVKAFNFAYYNKQFKNVAKQTVHYDPFFYPLDFIGEWNKMYGKNGFFQFQCVIPPEAVKPFLNEIALSGKGSFLSVLKEFGDKKSIGMLSFPRKGVTIALDFKNDGEKTLTLLNRLDCIVKDSGGAIYPAKDAMMPAGSFKAYYPKWEEFSEFIDPKFSSGFWRRVTGE